ncbi:hypothetical protein PIB30_057057 [Stylosanthes scabra]|uniref:Uncharacterized protein n=1 Tax=Stylosanthes scabra TaxID=79078 RepID=A0ABU6YGZ1_9FABA|nr:hypothetical protein [Stylosanthes scabra]
MSPLTPSSYSLSSPPVQPPSSLLTTTPSSNFHTFSSVAHHPLLYGLPDFQHLLHHCRRRNSPPLDLDTTPSRQLQTQTRMQSVTDASTEVSSSRRSSTPLLPSSIGPGPIIYVEAKSKSGDFKNACPSPISLHRFCISMMQGQHAPPWHTNVLVHNRHDWPDFISPWKKTKRNKPANKE